jgi:SAM-dependent methyltransferase
MTSEATARYYNRNTRRFLRFGGGGAAGAIHRPVWAPDVTDRTGAFEYLNRCVAEAVRPVLPPQASARLLDLGCGVGGTATWLALRLPVEVTGITNSAVQVEIARKRAAGLGLDRRCRFLDGDFLDPQSLEADAGGFTAAYAIESFAHAADPRRFFAQTASALAQGGRLVICDDFLSAAGERAPENSPAGRTLRRFKAGWHIANLLTAERAAGLAAALGLQPVETQDLTPYLRSFHPLLLRLMLAVTRLPLRWAYWQNLSAGSALQMCIRRGWTRYQVLVFEKS